MTSASVITYISLAVAVSILFPASSVAQVSCNENSDCLYGGTCHEGSCSCIFTCSTANWGKELYCGYGNKKIFKNLCDLQSHACSLQFNIPVIELKSRKFRNQVCSKKNRLRPTHTLCSHVIDFPGVCGTGGGNPGVCLESKQNGETFCKCPMNKQGLNCETTLLSQEDLPSKTRSSAIIAVSVTFFLAFALALSCILNKQCKKAAGPKNCAYLLERMRIQRKGDEQCRTLTELEGKQFSNHERDSPPVVRAERTMVVLDLPNTNNTSTNNKEESVNERTRLNSNN